MPSRCAVPQCKGSGGFKFPTDPDLNMEWRLAIKRMGPDTTLWKPGPHSVVCDKHFEAEDFREPLHRSIGRTCRSLKDGVIPSVFPFTATESTSARSAPNSNNIGKTINEEKLGLPKMTEEGQYTCHLCGITFQRVQNIIENHAKMHHHMSLKQFYYSSLVCSKDKQLVNGANVTGLYKETPLAPTSMSDNKATKVSVEEDPGELSSDSEHYILPDRGMKRCALKAGPPDTEKVEGEDAATIVCQWTSPQLCAKGPSINDVRERREEYTEDSGLSSDPRPDLRRDLNPDARTYLERKWKFPCDKCSYIASKYSHLENHVKVVHPGKIKDEAGFAGVYNCNHEGCGKYFLHPASLKCHAESAHSIDQATQLAPNGVISPSSRSLPTPTPNANVVSHFLTFATPDPRAIITSPTPIKRMRTAPSDISKMYKCVKSGCGFVANTIERMSSHKQTCAAQLDFDKKKNNSCITPVAKTASVLNPLGLTPVVKEEDDRQCVHSNGFNKSPSELDVKSLDKDNEPHSQNIGNVGPSASKEKSIKVPTKGYDHLIGNTDVGELVCLICKKKMKTTVRSMRDHIQRNHFSAPVKCPECDVKIRRSYLNWHIKQMHKGVPAVGHEKVCEDVGKKLSQQDHKILKLVDHEKLKDEAHSSEGKLNERDAEVLNSDAMDTSPPLQETIGDHEGPSDESFWPMVYDSTYACFWPGCQRWGQPNQCRSNLFEHMRCHTPNGSLPFVCKLQTDSHCRKMFARAEDLNIHNATHTSERPNGKVQNFCCKDCGKMFSNEDNLKRHAVTHHPSLKCGYTDCDSRFADYEQLFRHGASHKAVYICQERGCAKSFQYPSSRAVHMRDGHGHAEIEISSLMNSSNSDEEESVDSPSSAQSIRDHNEDVKINGMPIDVLRVVDLKKELAKRGLPKHGHKRDQVQRLRKYLRKNSNGSDPKRPHVARDAPSPKIPSNQPVDMLRVVDLKEELAKYGLPKHGNKRDQLERLSHYLKKQKDLGEKTEDAEFRRSLIESAFWFDAGEAREERRDFSNEGREADNNTSGTSKGGDLAASAVPIAAPSQQEQVLSSKQLTEDKCVAEYLKALIWRNVENTLENINHPDPQPGPVIPQVEAPHSSFETRRFGSYHKAVGVKYKVQGVPAHWPLYSTTSNKYSWSIPNNEVSSIDSLSKTIRLNGKTINETRVLDLKEELAKRYLPKHGKQQQLIHRLTYYLKYNAHECDPEYGGDEERGRDGTNEVKDSANCTSQVSNDSDLIMSDLLGGDTSPPVSTPILHEQAAYPRLTEDTSDAEYLKELLWKALEPLLLTCEIMRINGKPINILRVVDLKEELAKRGLPKHGKQRDLIFRLTKYLKSNPHECDPEVPDIGPDKAGGGDCGSPQPRLIRPSEQQQMPINAPQEGVSEEIIPEVVEGSAHLVPAYAAESSPSCSKDVIMTNAKVEILDMAWPVRLNIFFLEAGPNRRVLSSIECKSIHNADMAIWTLSTDEASKVLKLDGKPINVLRVHDLMKELKKRNLPRHCKKKQDLVHRLTNYLRLNPHECDPMGQSKELDSARGCLHEEDTTTDKEDMGITQEGESPTPHPIQSNGQQLGRTGVQDNEQICPMETDQLGTEAELPQLEKPQIADDSPGQQSVSIQFVQCPKCPTTVEDNACLISHLSRSHPNTTEHGINKTKSAIWNEGEDEQLCGNRVTQEGVPEEITPEIEQTVVKKEPAGAKETRVVFWQLQPNSTLKETSPSYTKAKTTARLSWHTITTQPDIEDNLKKLSKVMKLNGRVINFLRVLDLKKELGKRDLPKHGNQQQLVYRLTYYLQHNPHECDPEDSNSWADLVRESSKDPNDIAEKHNSVPTGEIDSSHTLVSTNFEQLKEISVKEENITDKIGDGQNIVEADPDQVKYHIERMIALKSEPVNEDAAQVEDSEVITRRDKLEVKSEVIEA